MFRFNRKSRIGNRRSRCGGFTLIEAALATVIIGTGVLSIMAAQQAYHRKNDWAARVGTAMLLANELRELTLTLPMHDPITGTATMGPEGNENGVAAFDDLDDFAGEVEDGIGVGTTFDPPINALRQDIGDLDGWSQRIEVFNVLEDNVSVSDDLTQPLGTTQLMRVTVSVFHQGPRDEEPVTMTQLTWIVAEE